MADCKICGDSGYIMRKDIEWHHPEFGKLQLCECHPDYVSVPEPKKREPDLSWAKWMNNY